MQNDTVLEMNPKIGNLIKDERAKKAWTQLHLAEAAGVTERTIQRLEKGEVPSKETLLGVASALGIEIEKLTAEASPEKAKEKIVFLPQILFGKDAIEISWGAHLSDFRHPQLDGEAADVVGAFLQNLQDMGEIGPELGIGYRIECAKTLNDQLNDVQKLGYLLFGGNRNVKIITGQNQAQSRMNLATVVVVRHDEPTIIQEGDMKILPMLISLEPQPF